MSGEIVQMKQSTMFNQHLRCAIECLLVGNWPGVSACCTVCHEILGQAQNGPEHGADGSFTEKSWTHSRDLLRSFESFVKLCEGITE